MVDPFRNYQWLFVFIMPFGPIMLDLQGFYQSPLNKSLVRAMLGLAIIVSGCCLFLRLPLPARTVPLLFITVLFRQERAGRFGKPFVMLNFDP